MKGDCPNGQSPFFTNLYVTTSSASMNCRSASFM